MRIEPYAQVQQLYKTNKTEKTKSTASAGRKDQVEISSFGMEIQAAKQAVAASSDIREDVVAPIKSSIAAGTYSVSNEEFSDKLIDQYESMKNM